VPLPATCTSCTPIHDSRRAHRRRWNDSRVSAQAESAPDTVGESRWLTPGVRGIGVASLLADLGHEVPTALLPGVPFA
jgi:hypothetical protein